MRNPTALICVPLLLIAFSTIASNDKAQANAYDDAWESAWVTHCRSVLSGGSGKTTGFVLEVGDSITHSNPYKQWPHYGSGKTAEDSALCTWAQTGNFPGTVNDTTSKNGFYLSSADTTGSRGMTAAGGISTAEFLSGSGNGNTAMPMDTTPTTARTKIASSTYDNDIQIDTLIAAFNDAQFAVLMLGTNDANGGRSSSAFITDLTTIVNKFEAQHIVVVLSTIPPTTAAGSGSIDAYNTAIRNFAQSRGLPLIDFYAEILARRSGSTWQNTLISGDGIHPSASGGVYSSPSDPYADGGDPSTHRTGAACDNVGYLLRSWLTIQKLKEVKSYVIDGNNPPAGVASITVTPASANISAGGTQQFSAVAKDSGGNTINPQPTFTWSVDGGGSVNGSGLVSSSTTAGGPYTVSASASGKTGTASFTVVHSSTIASVTVSPANATVAPGGHLQFTATVKDNYGNVANDVTVSWSLSGGGTIDYTGAVTAGSAVGGPFTVTASASGQNGTAQLTISTTNHPPSISSSATASPNPAGAGESVSFSVAASDPDGDALTYTWNFGDGSSATGSSVTHTYTTAANYSVSVSAADPKGLSANAGLTVIVTAGTGSGSSSDTFTPGFTVTTLKGAFSLTPGKDSCAFTGIISNIPAGFNPDGVNAQLTFGSAVVPLTLNSRGQARATNGSLQLKLKPSVRDPLTKKSSFAGGDVTFKASLTHGDWGAAWGVDPATLLAATTKDIVLTVSLGDKTYQANMTVNLAAKSKGAKFFK